MKAVRYQPILHSGCFGNETRSWSSRSRFPDLFWSCDIGMSAEFDRQPGRKTQRTSWSGAQVSHRISVHNERLATRHFACAHETVSTWRVTFQIAPENTRLQRSIISVGQVCDRGNTITFRSTGGTILDESTGNRIEFERAGGVYRLRAGMSAKMLSGPGVVKVLMGFELVPTMRTCPWQGEPTP